MAGKAPTVEFPVKRDTPKARGQALAYWLQENGWTQTAFCNASQISRPILNRYLSGSYDLANMTQELVERLLDTMKMSDADAVKYFGIPKAAEVRWRTFRPPPMGRGMEGQTPASQRSVSLRDGLKGEITVNGEVGAGLILAVDEQVTSGLMVIRQGGSLWVMQVRENERAGGEVLGGFAGIQVA